MPRLVGLRSASETGWQWFVAEDEHGHRRPRPWLLLPALAVIAGLAFAGFSLLRDAGDTSAAPLSGAIFTTTPDGSIVNENVRYDSKKEVYLDGGPPPNAPQTAAGLPDGDYVFQVTDPPGKVLLSEDASKCRVFRVSNGVIVTLRDKTNGFVDHTASDGCHVNDSPDGAAGATGKHDTNTDVDHGPPAIVVQLMPFFDTPNPGGVYKAWVIPISRYLANGGILEATPAPQCVRNGRPANNCNGGAVKIGYQRDSGFGPPRDQVKTDNFKVKEFFPPEIKVRKFHDINGDGVWQQATEPEIGVNQCVNSSGDIIACPGGWPYDFTEPVDGGTVTNTFYTPNTHVAGIAGTYTACEFRLPGWTQSAAYLDGVRRNADQCVSVAVAGTSGEKHEIIFGNFRPPEKHGQKFIDLNGNGRRDAGEGCPTNPSDVNYPGCVDVTVKLDGADNTGAPVHLTTKTCGGSVPCPAGKPYGSYWFTGLNPGSYRVTVVEPTGFECSYPTPCYYDITLLSGDKDTGNDFGDFSRAEVHGVKFFDHNGNSIRDPNDEGLPDVQVRLDGTDGLGNPVHLVTYTCGGTQVACPAGEEVGSYWFMDLRPGTYTISELAPTGFTQTAPLPIPPGTYIVTLTSDQVCEDKDFGNFGPCAGLTPGYWSNWRNHYTAAQFLSLLQGTVAQGSIANADNYLNSIGCDNGDALHCMRRFLLADQLTLNLTASTDPNLFRPVGAGLVGLCSIPGIGTLQQAINTGLAILANPGTYTRDQILEAKNNLAAFAEL